jgi:hypothetical protein
MEQRTGRIDRIDSMAYRALNNPKNSCQDHIPFENKLQVFYPYLADTLEVNQMVKLFKEMDNFIDVFYNDLSANIEKDSKADINDVIIDIPEQRKELLKSKYDYPGFVPQYNGTAMQVRLNTQITSDELLAHLKNVCNELSGFAFFEKPLLDQPGFSVSGVINLDGRRGPFNLYLKQDKQPGKFFYQMESLLGRSQVLGRSSNKREVHSEIEKYSKEKESVFTVKESNSLVFLTLKVGLEASIKEITTKLYTLVEVTDQIEERVLGVDEKLA